MKLKHEARLAEVPNSLILGNNNSTKKLEDLKVKRNSQKVSPETLSHRLEKGWQHLQECPDTALNSNDNNNGLDFNDNGLFDDDINVAASVPAPLLDGEYRAMSSEDDDSSSDDDSSASYSDTSPLLDVSSLENSDASDMSEDSSSSSSSSSSCADEDSLLDDCSNLEDDDDNNNGGDDDDMVSLDPPSMQSSWMSFSSAASTPSVAAAAGAPPRVLPDVLPVGEVSRDDDEDDARSTKSVVSTRNVEITVEKRRSSALDAAGGSGGERCLVEITAQPDVQVDIRVNPPPYRESKPLPIKHGNTYPREAKNSKKHHFRNRNSNPWIVNDSFEEPGEDGGSPKFWTLGEGIRLNNFTIMSGHKTLSLTEIVNSNSNDETDVEPVVQSSHAKNTENSKRSSRSGHVLANAYQNFERNYSKPPTSIHLYSKDNWRHQREDASQSAKKNASVEASTGNQSNTILQDASVETFPAKKNAEAQRSVVKELPADKPKLNPFLCPSGTDKNSNQLISPERVPLRPKEVVRREYRGTKARLAENRHSSAEQFEVYTMETTMPHINWAAVNKTSRESEWMKKRRNDREEIRRKLAMDSDTEDYISEKLNQHRKSGSSFDHLKGSGSLQICFMNEAANDQEFSDEKESQKSSKNCRKESPKPLVQKPPLPLAFMPPPKCDKTASLPSNNGPLSVVKRQRPKFFFNRPRSWHASKPDETEEDLLTRHIRLQTEAREALAQAKEMAKMQMELERQKKKKSPIADIVGLPFPDGKNLLTHHALISMNVAQLQVIVNDLHSQIETLNEDLVKFLLERDDLHMEQDSMLVDIEDLTRYLGLKGSGSASSSGSVNSSGTTSNNKKFSQKEAVTRSQSVHLKSKNLMWPLQQLSLFSHGSANSSSRR